MAANRFVISCSSSHVDGVFSMLEAWRQDGNNPDRIFVHDMTQNWPTVTVAGPKARDILGALDLGIDLSPSAFPHMTLHQGRFMGAPAWVARVSFTGNVSFESSTKPAQNGNRQSIGFVISSYDSPTLGHPIALALVAGGAAVWGRM